MAGGGPVTAANDALLRDFAIRAVKAQPLGYLRAVLGGLAQSVEWPRRPYADSGTVYLYYFHLTPWTVPAHHSWVAGATAYSDTVQYGHAVPSRVVRPIAILIDGYERVFYTYGPLFGLILLTGLGGVLGIQIQRRPLRLIRLAGARRAGSALPWVTAVVLLVFPIAVADFDYRSPVPGPPVRLPGGGPGVRAGQGSGHTGTGAGPAGRRPHQPGARPGGLSRSLPIRVVKALPFPSQRSKHVQERR